MSPRRCAWAPKCSRRSKKKLKDAGHNTNVGDEGGFAPNLASTDDALGFVMQAIEAAGYKPGEDVLLALDAASTEFFKDGKYDLDGEGKMLDPGGMVDYWADLVGRYPIISIEDGMAEDDWEGWAAADRRHRQEGPAGRRRPVRDQPGPPDRRHQEGRRQLDPGQGQPDRHPVRDPGRGRDGAQGVGYTAVMSHRSGETEDSTIADLAVATNCGQIKTGSLSRSDRLAKYNQLIRIEEQLGDAALFAGKQRDTRIIPQPFSAPVVRIDSFHLTRWNSS